MMNWIDISEAINARNAAEHAAVVAAMREANGDEAHLPAAPEPMQAVYDSGDGHWRVARNHLHDPGQGWAVFEVRGGRHVRRLPHAHLATAEEAQALAGVLDGGVLRAAARAAELATAAVTIVAVRAMRRALERARVGRT